MNEATETDFMKHLDRFRAFHPQIRLVFTSNGVFHLSERRQSVHLRHAV